MAAARFTEIFAKVSEKSLNIYRTLYVNKSAAKFPKTIWKVRVNIFEEFDSVKLDKMYCMTYFKWISTDDHFCENMFQIIVLGKTKHLLLTDDGTVYQVEYVSPSVRLINTLDFRCQSVINFIRNIIWKKRNVL